MRYLPLLALLCLSACSKPEAPTPEAASATPDTADASALLAAGFDEHFETKIARWADAQV